LPEELGLDDGAQYGLTGRLARVVGDNRLGSANIGSDLAEFAIAPGRQTQVLRIQGDGAGTEHFYVHVIGKPIEQECVDGSTCPSFDLESTQAGFEGRPSLLTPFLTPLPDEDSDWILSRVFRQQRQAFQQNPSDNLDDVPLEPLPSHVWQYRPEYQFSQFDLEVQEINRNFVDQDEENATINLLDTPNNSVITLGDSFIDIFYSLTDAPFDRLPAIDGDQELIISFGGNEQIVTFGDDQQIVFEDLNDLAELDAEDLLNIRLYTNNDASNILYEFQFESAISVDFSRTTSLARFNSTETSTGTIADVTDSFARLVALVLEDSIVNVEVLDADLQSVGVLVPNQETVPGNYGFVVTYGDLEPFIEDEAQFYIAVNQRSLLTEEETRSLYTGLLQNQVDSEVLGQTISHDTLIQRGSLTLRREDIMLKGVGPQLNFIRSYSNESLVSDQASPMGSGWNHNHNISLQVLSLSDGQGVFGFNNSETKKNLHQS